MNLYVDIGPWFGLAVMRYEGGKQMDLDSIPLFVLSSLRAGLAWR